jgi:hypothetical protein
MSSFLISAFSLVQFGWKVFPLATGAKIPMIPAKSGGRGCLDATDDEEIIGEWDRRYPSANIGLACGIPSGIIVIDIDPRNGGTSSVEKFAARKQILPPTVEVATANGGRHLYYAWQPELKNSKSALGPGIDIKTTGGYVVAPPSVLDGGKKYTWVNSPLGEHLPRLPMWVVAALKPKPEPKYTGSTAARDLPKTINGLVRTVANAGVGNRNNALYWAACSAAEDGIPAGTIMAALLGAASQCGLPKIEAEKTIISGIKAGGRINATCN